MATDVADLLIRIEASTAQLRTQLSQAERATQQASTAMSRSLRAVDVANDNAVRSSGNLRNALHGVSLQAQDMVVQLAAGTNPLQVLIQQGGQVAGAFGPAFGPAGLLIVGVGAAALAIQALVGRTSELTAAADAAARTADALDRTLADGIDTADDLAASYRAMTDELRAFERVAISSAERRATEELETVRNAIDGQVASIRAGFEAFEAAQQNARQMFAGQITPELEAEYVAAEQVRQALEDFAAGGSANELAIALDSLAAAGGEVVGPLREILDGSGDGAGLIELARQANTAAETIERLNAARAILEGTATPEQIATFNKPRDSKVDTGSQTKTLDAYREQTRELEKQIEVRQRMAVAYGDGQAAVTAVERDLAILTQTQKLNSKFTDEQVAALTELITKLYDAGSAAEEAQALFAVDQGLERRLEEAQLSLRMLGASNVARQREIELLRLRNQLLDQGLTPAEADQEVARRAAEVEQIIRLEEQVKNTVTATDVLKDSFDVVGSTIANSISKGEDAFASLGNVAESVLTSIIAKMIELAAINPLMNSLFGSDLPVFGGFGGSNSSVWLNPDTGQYVNSGGGLFGDLGASLGNLFGGLFAEGGRPPMGKVSVVGEKGPELFVPDTAGTIIPNGKLGGMTFAPVYQIDARNSTLSAGEIRAIVDASSRKAVDDVRNLMNRTGSARI